MTSCYAILFCFSIYTVLILIWRHRSRPGADPVVTIDLPKALSDPVINALKADPRFVDIRAQAPHFYRLAVRILALMEADEIDDVLIEVCPS